MPAIRWLIRAVQQSSRACPRPPDDSGEQFHDKRVRVSHGYLTEIQFRLDLMLQNCGNAVIDAPQCALAIITGGKYPHEV